MAEPRITFAELRDLLGDLGFRQIAISDQHTAFQGEDPETLTALPIYQDKEFVLPIHIAAIRGMLRHHGVLDTAEFDRRLASRVAKTSAS